MSQTETEPGTELERRHWRQGIPPSHQINLDTRIQWLWNQRFGTIQMIALRGSDLQDITAANIFIQAIMGGDMDSIDTIFRRLEGGPQSDEEVLARSTLRF